MTPKYLAIRRRTGARSVVDNPPTVGLAAAAAAGERRVALVPGDLALVQDAGYRIVVEAGSGDRSGIADGDYAAQGAELVRDRSQLLAVADIVTIAPRPDDCDLAMLKPGATVIGLLDPIARAGRIAELASAGIRAFAFELIPRIARAQSMDVLSAMATLAGYKAVLLAADRLPQIFPLLMTAAGTLRPARVVILGVGVAGLQAIATARRLGAQVFAYDVRDVVREQVESLGARFIELDLETENLETAGGYARDQSADFLLRQQRQLGVLLSRADVVITTALVAGARAPILVTNEMLAMMRPGSVLVDLAAAKGGNCEASQPNQTVDFEGVQVIGLCDAESQLAVHASQMYSRNLARFLSLLAENGFDPRADAILAGSLVADGGVVVSPPVLAQLEPAITGSA